MYQYLKNNWNNLITRTNQNNRSALSYLHTELKHAFIKPFSVQHRLALQRPDYPEYLEQIEKELNQFKLFTPLRKAKKTITCGSNTALQLSDDEGAAPVPQAKAKKGK